MVSAIIVIFIMDGISFDPDFRFPYRFSSESLRDGINQRRIRECIQSENSRWFDLGQDEGGIFFTVLGFSDDNLPRKTRIYIKFGLGFSEKDTIEINDTARPAQEEFRHYWCR
jgi:hypothetical protein